jgi:hypothetical protein
MDFFNPFSADVAKLKWSGLSDIIRLFLLIWGVYIANRHKEHSMCLKAHYTDW